MNRETLAKVVVVDASLAAMWVLPEQYADTALLLADDWGWAGVEIIAPNLMLAEVDSALFKRVRRREMSIEQAQDALDVVLGFGVRFEDEPGLHHRALAIAHRLDRPTPYDALYLALAELRGCEVWTGDERLYNAARSQLPWVRWIGEYCKSSRGHCHDPRTCL
ncbi:MAG: type II toxin-antitoxin system VapC family toxin [Chloroflexi bacterium]|nr:type II toxin-antitoxin system VapC family toxin [Chloroflexota bacterium]